jgi:hypothetical protein
MTRTRPFPYLFLINGTRNPPVQPADDYPVGTNNEQRSCHWAIFALRTSRLARALYQVSIGEPHSPRQ